MISIIAELDLQNNWNIQSNLQEKRNCWSENKGKAGFENVFIFIEKMD